MKVPMYSICMYMLYKCGTYLRIYNSHEFPVAYYFQHCMFMIYKYTFTLDTQMKK